MPKTPATPSIALVYDRATVAHGGAEEFLQVLHRAFPTAPLYTSLWNPSLAWTNDWRVIPSFLQTIPGSHRFHRLLAPLMPLAFETLDLSSFDVVLSVSSAEAKGVLTKPNQLHISYLFTPTRYLYEYATAYSSDRSWFQWPLVASCVRLVQRYLVWWDGTAALRPDRVLTLSHKAAKKIETVYHRQATVLYPPIASVTNDTQNSSLQKQLNHHRYLIALSRLVPYKKIDQAIRASQLSRQTLVIVGVGPDEGRLRQAAQEFAVVRGVGESLIELWHRVPTDRPSIVFCHSISEAEKQLLLTSAAAACMLGDEDYGLAALQSAALGIPTIVNASAGAMELLREVKHCYAINPDNTDELVQAMKAAIETSSVPAEVQSIQKNVVEDLFLRQIRTFVYDEWQNYMKKYDSSNRGGRNE